MSIPLKIVSICALLWYIFQKHVVLQLIHIYINSITDECSLFIFLPCLECCELVGEGFDSLIGTTFPWYLHIGTVVVSQSITQCITVDIFPHILANVVDIQKVHLLLHTPLLNKTPRLSSARTFVKLYRLLLIQYIVYMYHCKTSMLCL